MRGSAGFSPLDPGDVDSFDRPSLLAYVDCTYTSLTPIRTYEEATYRNMTSEKMKIYADPCTVNW